MYTICQPVFYGSLSENAASLHHSKFKAPLNDASIEQTYLHTCYSLPG